MNKSTTGFMNLVFLIRKVNIEHISNIPIITINRRFHFRVNICTSEYECQCICYCPAEINGCGKIKCRPGLADLRTCGLADH